MAVHSSFTEMERIIQFYCSLEPIMLYCMEDLLGGPKIFKVKTAVNIQVMDTEDGSHSF